MSTLETLQEILARDYGLPRDRLSPDAALDTLGMDSLSLLELMFKIEEDFHLKIPGDPPSDLKTVHDVVVYIDGLIADPAAQAAPEAVAAHEVAGGIKASEVKV